MSQTSDLPEIIQHSITTNCTSSPVRNFQLLYQDWRPDLVLQLFRHSSQGRVPPDEPPRREGLNGPCRQDSNLPTSDEKGSSLSPRTPQGATVTMSIFGCLVDCARFDPVNDCSCLVEGRPQQRPRSPSFRGIEEGPVVESSTGDSPDDIYRASAALFVQLGKVSNQDVLVPLDGIPRFRRLLTIASSGDLFARKRCPESSLRAG